MNLKVRGCEAILEVEDDTSGKAIKLWIRGSNVKDEVEALKKLKEWGFIQKDKANLGSNKEAV